ncbi:unnamed protein product [Brachionus calyciflorus]|uniref:Peptidase S1 domain-containing protein n=1 Tax=Brachionus calyciflorus TaxID=104777 RepID=A0A814Q5E1_9BILA|nr:unnamed protein product [Brachionus calyciflorus]
MKCSSFAFYLTIVQSLFILNQITGQFDYECGVPDVKPQTKIVNGQVALNNSWPWMVAMMIDNSFTCGGSIIAPDWILTAAHCVEDVKDIRKYKFIYGTNNLNDPQTESNTAFASKIYMHPDYFSTVIYNDIALIKLTKKIKFSKKVKPICLPNTVKLDEIEKKIVVATGWGMTNWTADVSKLLLQASLVIKNNKSEEGCDYSRYNNYCALGLSNDSNICQGDSGGPLQYFKNGKWFVYGLSSFTTSNEKVSCINTELSYFTTVPFYLEWIKRVVSGKPSQPYVKKNCGIRTQKRIVGGTVSKINAWPWIVQIRFYINNVLNFALSGTLISNQHVLTLNNKIFESNLKNIFVALGSNELVYYPDSNKLYSVISVKKIQNNLIVLKLHRPVTNPNVSPICLPNSKQSSLILNKEITTAGWGSIDGTVNSSSASLLETRLTVKNDANECKKYSSSSYCTFGKNKNICFGDLGNPVMYSVNKKWTLFGIFYRPTTDSNGIKCDTSKMSLAYNIINYLNSIKLALK